MMRLTNSLLFLCTLMFVRGQNYDPEYMMYCNELDSKSATLRLKKHLFCDYDPSVRPSLSHKNATLMRFAIIPYFFFVEEDNNVMDLHCWSILHWDDAHLTWNPVNFDDIQFLHVTSNEIWVPDITVHGASDLDVELEIPFTNCWLYKDGDVKCVPETMYTTICERDQTWWPYDIQNCTFQFALWSHSDDEVLFTFLNGSKGSGLIMSQLQSNPEWDVIMVYTTERKEVFKFASGTTSRSLSVHFILKRHASALQAVYGTIVIALMLLTLTTLWMDSKCIERTVLGIFNFVCHFLCMQDLHWKTSTSAVKSSNLMMFLVGSLILTSFTLILTSLLKHLLQLKRETPAWIATRVSIVSNSRIGRILLISVLDPKASAGLDVKADDNDSLVCSSKQQRLWKYLVILISWIAFFVVFLTYIVLLITFFPRERSAQSTIFKD